MFLFKKKKINIKLEKYFVNITLKLYFFKFNYNINKFVYLKSRNICIIFYLYYNIFINIINMIFNIL